MRQMRTIAIDDPGVCQSVCHVGGLCKTDERINALFGDQRSIVLDGLPIPHGKVSGPMRPLTNYFEAKCYCVSSHAE